MLKKIVISFVFSLLASGAHAQWAVFDAANFIKNTISSAELVISEAQRATQIANQVAQLNTMTQNLQEISGAVNSVRNNELFQNINQLRQYSNMATQLYGSIQSTKGMMEGRMREWSMSGMSWGDYVSLQQKMNQQRGERNEFLRDQEVRTMDDINRQYSEMQSLGAQIPQIQGNKDGLQLLNSQMNNLISQTAQMRAFEAQSRAAATNEADMERSRDIANQKDRDEFYKAQKQAGQNATQAAEGFRQLKIPTR